MTLLVAATLTPVVAGGAAPAPLPQTRVAALPPAAPQSPSPEPLQGEIVGTIRLAGDEVPKPVIVENHYDPGLCGPLQERRDLRVSAERGVADVLVTLTGIDATTPVPPPVELVLDNRDCQFVPTAAAIPVGSTIRVVNHDEGLHTAHFHGPLNRNVALPDPSVSVALEVHQPGIITVLCEVHPWMRAYIRVGRHPFQTVADADGHFRIVDVPAGSYGLEAWHARLGILRLQVRIEEERQRRIVLVYPGSRSPAAGAAR